FSFDHHRSFVLPANSDSALSVLDRNMSYSYTGWTEQMDSISPRVIKSSNCFATMRSFELTSNPASKPATNHSDGDWLYSDSTIVKTGSILESLSPKPAGNKRPSIGENTQVSKKAKTKTTNSPKDPQSQAAKNRRERISERLKVLQELVPNGTKVDLVTMLEKAIGYVKFLQLQVNFWPTQGRKAPDISQVKEAIDAILSQQDMNSN
ncbi:hypothetical protein CARUB_v10007389mg, partial [Capsella rubella]